MQVYACRACKGGPAAEEQSGLDSVVLMRRGAFRRHFGSRSVTADVNQVAFFAKGSVHRVSHPADCGDRGTILSAPPRILGEIARELDPAAEERQAFFPAATAPCGPALYWRHRAFLRRLEAALLEPLDALEADIATLQLIADALHAAHERRGAAGTARRRSTQDDHAETTEAAKAWLAAHAAESVSLDDVAAAVHASPFHLARLFHRHAGMPVHRYLVRLRLRSALERLLDGGEPLSDVALLAGFASHAHLSSAFRREFGVTPSEVRRDSARALQLSKNLKD